MSAMSSNRTHLAILVSVIGVALPWHRVACAQGETEGRMTALVPVESQQSSIRSVLGLSGASSRPRRADAAPHPNPRRANGLSHVVVLPEGATPRWNAAALGLGRLAEDHTERRGRVVQAGDVGEADIERIRSILGLDREPVLAAVMAPKEALRRRAADTSVASTRTVEPAPIASAARPPVAPDNAPATGESDANALVTTDGAEPNERASLIPDSAPSGTGADTLSRFGEPALPRGRHERDPAPAITDATQIVRRSGLVTTATLSLPPEDVESLDETLRIRLRGQFRPLERNDTASSRPSTSDASADDPLLALLQVLSNRDEDLGRPAPIIFVASAPEDPRAAVQSAAVFRHVAEGITHCSAAPSVAVLDAEPAPRPVMALPGVAVATAAVIAAIPETAPLTRTAMREVTPPFAGGDGSREPMLPMNPFAWYGDDAIDLSVSLTGHPLLVALPTTPESRGASLQMALALRQSPEPLPFVHHAMTDIVDIFDQELTLVAPLHTSIALRQPPIVAPMVRRAMTEFVDIFDPELTLARVDGAGRRRTVGVEQARPRSRTQVPTDERPDAPTTTVIVREIEPQPTLQAAPAVMVAADENRLNALRGYPVALADSKLDELRGGFETDGGLKVSFGIERAVYINGNLVTSTSLNVADLSKLTAGQIQTMGLDRATLGIIQSGPNNTFSPGQFGASSVATVIQNTLNDQRIQGITQINATVNSLDLIRKSNIQQNIQSALADSIRH